MCKNLIFLLIPIAGTFLPPLIEENQSKSSSAFEYGFDPSAVVSANKEIELPGKKLIRRKRLYDHLI